MRLRTEFVCVNFPADLRRQDAALTGVEVVDSSTQADYLSIWNRHQLSDMGPRNGRPIKCDWFMNNRSNTPSYIPYKDVLPGIDIMHSWRKWTREFKNETSKRFWSLHSTWLWPLKWFDFDLKAINFVVMHETVVYLVMPVSRRTNNRQMSHDDQFLPRYFVRNVTSHSHSGGLGFGKRGPCER